MKNLTGVGKQRPHRHIISTDSRQPGSIGRTRRRLILNKILVPVDFSPCSFLAAASAIALARRFGACVVLLHVAEIGSPAYELGATDFPDMEFIIRRELRRKFLALFGKRVGLQVSIQVQAGWPFPGGKRPFAEIVEAARALNVDLIVIGTHGRTGLDHLLIGSTAERVVRHAPCPVLVVRGSGYESFSRSKAARNRDGARDRRVFGRG
jgi:universal stress protein A